MHWLQKRKCRRCKNYFHPEVCRETCREWVEYINFKGFIKASPEEQAHFKMINNWTKPSRKYVRKNGRKDKMKNIINRIKNYFMRYFEIYGRCMQKMFIGRYYYGEED